MLMISKKKKKKKKKKKLKFRQNWSKMAMYEVIAVHMSLPLRIWQFFSTLDISCLCVDSKGFTNSTGKFAHVMRICFLIGENCKSLVWSFCLTYPKHGFTYLFRWKWSLPLISVIVLQYFIL